jgi:hypothetical protein
MADDLLEILLQIDPALELKYNKFYIGLARQGQADNFVIFRPQKNSIRVDHGSKGTKKSTENRSRRSRCNGLRQSLEPLRIRLGKGDPKKHTELLRELFAAAHKEFGASNG